MTVPAREEIRERTIGLLRRVARRPIQISDSSTLVGDLGFESIHVLELIVAVEQSFDITVEKCNYENIYTVADLLDAVEERLTQP